MYLKAFRVLMMWLPTSVLRPKARQSTTVMLRGGWRFSFSGSSFRGGREELSCEASKLLVDFVHRVVDLYVFVCTETPTPIPTPISTLKPTSTLTPP